MNEPVYTRPPLHLVLVHHPIADKRGDVVATSVTNLDIHDLARAARTFGTAGYWIVHPYPAMHRYVERVLTHWQEGWGAAYNPTREEALRNAHLVTDLGELANRLEGLHPDRPLVWVGTCARVRGRQLTYKDMRAWLHDPNDRNAYALVLGTGWGLHDEVVADMDYMLAPIVGPTDWNHLSVRAAAGILLDRLMGIW